MKTACRNGGIVELHGGLSQYSICRKGSQRIWANHNGVVLNDGIRSSGIGHNELHSVGASSVVNNGRIGKVGSSRFAAFKRPGVSKSGALWRCVELYAQPFAAFGRGLFPTCYGRQQDGHFLRGGVAAAGIGCDEGDGIGSVGFVSVRGVGCFAGCAIAKIPMVATCSCCGIVELNGRTTRRI